jgi:hypothetical protein
MMPEGGKMNDAEMDRILSNPDEILPSSGFAASVMEAVRREAAAPPPIPFPWKRALPVLALAAAALMVVPVVGVAAIVQLGQGSLAARLPSAPSPLFFLGGIGGAVGWTALALLTAFLSVKLSMRLAAGT